MLIYIEDLEISQSNFSLLFSCCLWWWLGLFGRREVLGFFLTSNSPSLLLLMLVFKISMNGLFCAIKKSYQFLEEFRTKSRIFFTSLPIVWFSLGFLLFIPFISLTNLVLPSKMRILLSLLIKIGWLFSASLYHFFFF